MDNLDTVIRLVNSVNSAVLVALVVVGLRILATQGRILDRLVRLETQVSLMLKHLGMS